MELREWAEQVLLATTLDEKLACPESITDQRPGSSLVAPDAPGRPRELRFKTKDSGTADFPGLHRLDDERERGRLLHFFANHELLATELMALVLLRFPEAPAAFRRGVCQTLKDEQIHTRLYLERMKECGIQFGEIPVSGYFWRSVSTMESPLDYVASLSLTFEQANLDFCCHFARGFEVVGDNDTARLLDRIYHDEIGHVASGLKWLRRWKNPEDSDWAAYCRQLKFPLSPQRAKGISLNVEGRRAAGLDPVFIAELNVYSQSRGRTPGVFLFNPFAEGRIAYGRSFSPVKHQVLLARDLANLPQFLCRQDDIVLLDQRPSVEFLSAVKQAGFALPEFVELGSAAAAPVKPDITDRSKHSDDRTVSTRFDGFSGLRHRKLGVLRPWAWGPDSLELLEPLLARVTAESRSADQRFNEKIARLYSKAWSAAFLGKLLARRKRSADTSWLCTELEVGVAVATLNEVLAVIDSIRRRGHHRIVVKEAHGLAGHNSIRLWEPELLESHRRWIARAVENGRQLVVEPWLERGLDFSVQLEMESGGLKLRGYTGLINDKKGQFQANWAEAGHRRRLPSDVAGLFREPSDIFVRLHDLYTGIFELLETELRDADYLGPIGIDAFVYRTPDGDFRLKPVVEINPRYTMGRLTVELMKQTCQGRHGLFHLVSLAETRAAGFDGFPAYAASLSKRFPIRLEGEPVSRIADGALCLNDPARAQVCLAVFQVSPALDTLVRWGALYSGPA